MNVSNPAESEQTQPALRVSHLSKTFPGQKALDDVSLELASGQIHALVGENGSGKSTLIKCLAGFHSPDQGSELEIDGRPIDLPLTPSDSIAAGLAFVHQDLGLIPTMSVLENMALSRGFTTGAGGRIRWRQEEKTAREALERLGAKINPRRVLGELGMAERSLVAIARALRGSVDTRVLVLDEPTAALPQEEVEQLVAALRDMASRGIAILYVSHRLPEVFALSSRITVLRDGRKVADFERDGLRESDLVAAIVGRALTEYYPEPLSGPTGEVVMSARGLAGVRVKETDLELRAGEVVGVAGLLGSGRSELARLLTGAQATTAGELSIKGKELAGGSTKEAIAKGIVLVPEDRRGAAAFTEQSLRENLTLPSVRGMTRFGRINRRRERATAEEMIREFNVNPKDPAKQFGLLSGGNQQKAILARWLSLKPSLIVLDEPVQGVDIGSRTEVYELIRRAADGGAAILLIDSELEDLARLSDRILVMCRGEITAELTGDGVKRDDIVESIFSHEGALA